MITLRQYNEIYRILKKSMDTLAGSNYPPDLAVLGALKDALLEVTAAKREAAYRFLSAQQNPKVETTPRDPAE